LTDIIVVKIGGATLGSHDTTIEDVVSLQKRGESMVVVHGGGKLITEWLDKRGLSSRFVRGERVTDKAALEVVIAVLAGLVNKGIAATINGRGGQAIGISGADGALIEAGIKDSAMGYVGTVVKVNVTPLKLLLESGYIPVVAPLGFYSIDRPEEAPQIVNVNADAVAGEIAAAIGSKQLVFLTDVIGVCDHSGKLLPRLSPDEAEALVVSGVASGGMIPKLKACLRALSNASTTCIIDGRQPHALLKEIEGDGGGTTIQSAS
jgi:acetylglutamate kinase